MVIVGLVPPPGLTVPDYEVPKSSGSIEICVEVIVGSVSTGLTATVTFSTIDISLQRKYFSVLQTHKEI